MCIDAVGKYPLVLRIIPECHKTNEMCKDAEGKDPDRFFGHDKATAKNVKH